MNIRLLVDGGTKWQERIEKALKSVKLTWYRYTRDKANATKVLVGKRLLLPTYVDLSQNYGERWRGLFQLLSGTNTDQTIVIRRNQFFPMMDDLSLTKRCYLLPAKRWESGRPVNPSVREGLEQQLENFTLEQVKDVREIPTGLDFEGVGPNTDMKVTTAYNWIREQAIYNNPAWKKKAKVKLHMGKDDLSQALEQGIRIVAENVPSLSGEEAPHVLTITNAPIYVENIGPSELTKRTGYGIKTSDDCGRAVFCDYKYGRIIKTAFGLEERVRSENEFDHHSILTLDIAKDMLAVQYAGLTLDYPIPAVPKGVEEFVEAAFRRIRVTDDKIANGGKMLWESVALMQIYTMMACAYVNTKNREVEKSRR